MNVWIGLIVERVGSECIVFQWNARGGAENYMTLTSLNQMSD